MIRATEPARLGLDMGPDRTLGYPVATTVARAARGPNIREGPERVQDGTA